MSFRIYFTTSGLVSSSLAKPFFEDGWVASWSLTVANRCFLQIWRKEWETRASFLSRLVSLFSPTISTIRAMISKGIIVVWLHATPCSFCVVSELYHSPYKIPQSSQVDFSYVRPRDNSTDGQNTASFVQYVIVVVLAGGSVFPVVLLIIGYLVVRPIRVALSRLRSLLLVAGESFCSYYCRCPGGKRKMGYVIRSCHPWLRSLVCQPDHCHPRMLVVLETPLHFGWNDWLVVNMQRQVLPRVLGGKSPLLGTYLLIF